MTDPSAPSLKHKAVAAAKWSSVATVLTLSVRFGRVALLARILSPSDFGLMGMIMVVLEFSTAFVNMGLGNAIIQRKNIHPQHLSSFFWLNVGCGVVVFGTITALSPVAARFFAEPKLAAYLIISATSFLIIPFGQIFATLLRKELRFKTLSQIEVGSALADAFITIVLASSGLGVASLVAGYVTRSLTFTVALALVFRRTWWPTFHFRMDEVRSSLAFAFFQLGQQSVNFLSANIDYIIIGRFLGAAELGVYRLAYELVAFPLSGINPMVVRVALPAFALIQDDDARLRRWYCRVIGFVCALSVPLLVGLCVVAPQFVPIVYGRAWLRAVPLVQILCVLGISKALMNPMGSVLLAKGRADVAFYWNLVLIAFVSAAVLTGVNWGITGVSLGLACLQPLLLIINERIVNWSIRLTLREYWQAVRAPLVSGAVMAVLVWVLHAAVAGWSAITVLVTCVGFGGAIYALAYYLVDKAFIQELFAMVWRRQAAR